jgi:hypothetical protein
VLPKPEAVRRQVPSRVTQSGNEIPEVHCRGQVLALKFKVLTNDFLYTNSEVDMQLEGQN